jgi:hypothetical protein
MIAVMKQHKHLCRILNRRAVGGVRRDLLSRVIVGDVRMTRL